VKLSDFDFDLPESQIAQFPPQDRSGGRLLVLGADSTAPTHHTVRDLPELLTPGDLLVMNNTRVYPARVKGTKESGGKIELLVERVLGEARALCLCWASKSPSAGVRLLLPENGAATVIGRTDDLFEIAFELDRPLLDYLEAVGELPLPPYIKRTVDASDGDRYQTVFASETGAVAAPTAGLHFDEALLQSCKDRGVAMGWTTLHVGAGTFQPVRTDDVSEHRMHAERLRVDQTLCQQVADTRRRGGRIIAVGTTVVRALETAAAGGALQPFEGDTRLFIKPGDAFNVVDGLVTNFHLPRSTLLMLVCAYAGTGRLLDAYRAAVTEGYRFFSYGDAMLLFPYTGDP